MFKTKEIITMIGPFKERWVKSKVVKEVYEARWVWYHTILAFELLIIIILLIGVLIKI